MTRYLILGVLTGFLLIATGCRPVHAPKKATFRPIAPRVLDADNALAEARALVALGPRAAGTPGARQAAGHLLLRLQAVGVQSTLDAFTDGLEDFRRALRRGDPEAVASFFEQARERRERWSKRASSTSSE